MNIYLEKIAAEAKKKTKGPDFGEHQTRVLEKLEAQGPRKGLVVAHGMGSGKTLTGLLAAKQVHDADKGSNVVAITPASLTGNFDSQEEEHKTGIDKKRFKTFSYDKATSSVEDIIKLNPKLLLLDEGHKLRNTDTARYQAIKQILAKTGAKPLILTGTPDYNKPSDMRVLVNLAANGKELPEQEKDFNDKFIGTRKVKPGFLGRIMGAGDGEIKHLKNSDKLKQSLTKYVDFYDGKTARSEDFPSSHEEDVNVTMSKRQHDLYRYLENELPAPIRWKVRLGLPLDKKESAALNSFSTGVRQVSNSTAPYEKGGASQSPKIEQIVRDHEEAMNNDKNFRGIIYSNYLEAGLNPLSKELDAKGIKHAIYDGSLSHNEKEALVKEYNEGKLKTLLVSSSGSEGLNLKGTKMVQTMEPHFNKKKIDQVVARGIRFKSHEHLPEDERHVTVKHYHSVLPKGMFDTMLNRHVNSIDEYLKKMSHDKAQIGEQMKNLVTSDPGHYKAAEHHPTIFETTVDKATNPARYLGSVQTSVLPGTSGRLLAKVEKILLTAPFKGEPLDWTGKRS